MYYELYIDVLFGVNFIMDFFLLLLVKKLTGCCTTLPRIVAGSIIGAAGFCLIILLPVSSSLLYLLLGYVLVSSGMIKVGLNTRGFAVFLKSFVCLYLSAFLLGGIYQWLSAGFRNFIFISIGSYLLLTFGLEITARIQTKKRRFYTVVVQWKGQQARMQALRDTGNNLRDPISGKPVSVIEYKAIRPILPEQDRKAIERMFKYENDSCDSSEETIRLHYIPFHSVGKQNGLLPGMTADKLYIKGEPEYEINKPAIAISAEPLSSDENYQMILHPDLMENHQLINIE